MRIFIGASQVWVLAGMVWSALAWPTLIWSQAIPLDCIDEIARGTRIDFERPGATVNDILIDFDMMSSPDEPITIFVPWVVGNACAPLGNRAGSGDGFRITPIGPAWRKIGLSTAGTLFEPRILTLSVFDVNDAKIGSITKIFDPGSDQDSYNNAILFLGFSSEVPIHAVELVSDDPNIGWDHIRFEPFDASFSRGDCNVDGSFDIADAIVLLDLLFSMGPAPICETSCDSNDDGALDISDAIYVLSALFSMGPPPPAPHPGCGQDPTPGNTGCTAYDSCP